MPTDYVMLPDRNLPIALPDGKTMLISFTQRVINVHWFEGSLKTEPIRRVTLDSNEWPGIFTGKGWNLFMVLELVLTIKEGDNRE